MSERPRRPGSMDERIAKLERADVELRGDRGDNGKVGTLRQDVDGLKTKSWALALLFVGGIAGGAAKLATISDTFGGLRVQAASTKEQVLLLEARLRSLESALYRHEPGKDH